MEGQGTEEEGGLRDKLFAWFARLGVTPVPGSGHTRRGRKGNACIDAIAVPEGQAWRWRVARAWRSDLSDHARLQIVAGNRASMGRSCTPADMCSLPVTALVDLRKVFSHVNLALGFHAHGRPADRARAPAAADRPPKPGDVPTLHPASGITCEGGYGPTCSACAPQAEGSVCGRRKFCATPSDRRRVRGTLRATAGAEGPRTRGGAAACQRNRHGRADGTARRPPAADDKGGSPPGGGEHAQGHEGRAKHDYAWDPVIGRCSSGPSSGTLSKVGGAGTGAARGKPARSVVSSVGSLAAGDTGRCPRPSRSCYAGTARTPTRSAPHRPSSGSVARSTRVSARGCLRCPLARGARPPGVRPSPKSTEWGRPFTRVLTACKGCKGTTGR